MLRHLFGKYGDYLAGITFAVVFCKIYPPPSWGAVAVAPFAVLLGLALGELVLGGFKKARD